MSNGKVTGNENVSNSRFSRISSLNVGSIYVKPTPK